MNRSMKAVEVAPVAAVKESPIAAMISMSPIVVIGHGKQGVQKHWVKDIYFWMMAHKKVGLSCLTKLGGTVIYTDR